MQSSRPGANNIVLGHLSDEDFELIEGHLQSVELPFRTRLAEPNVPVEHVYFLGDGIASIVMGVRRQPPIEIGIIGREGIVNLPILLGADRSPSSTLMQVAGYGMRMGSEPLRTAMAASATLTAALQVSAHVFMIQTASTVLANGRANTAQRLARWLLMAQDRLDSSELPLTHELLSMMLGVRRASVTTALRSFEARGLTSNERGKVTVLDRDALISTANGYYGQAEAELDRIYGNRTV